MFRFNLICFKLTLFALCFGVNLQAQTDNLDTLDEVVVTGTMRSVKKSESPVSVEIYTSHFFKKNPTPNLFEALQLVNGVRPQVNCNVCNTGDIHINGMEGPYTMVLIDGMPIVSSLATVYGLMGIPNGMIDRIEVVKGPASSLYGSEAMGGLINIVTKSATSGPKISCDFYSSTWPDANLDLNFTTKIGAKSHLLTGLNGYWNDSKRDENFDGFTDVAIQKRISLFQKLNIPRKQNKQFDMAWRIFNENRWGGEIDWKKEFEGGDSVYGESIQTQRIEFVGNYQLPIQFPLKLAVSFNHHKQNSFYGITPYNAIQRITFGQLLWEKSKNKHALLVGTTFRNTFYDDNTVATQFIQSDSVVQNTPSNINMPGVFVQEEYTFSPKFLILGGFRIDHHPKHKFIYSPRLAFKYTSPQKTVIRLNAGTGFRVVNLFTEDHAALTGARTVIIKNELRPEQSNNVNLNINHTFVLQKDALINLEASLFYSHFQNRIIPDYTTDPMAIIYDNLNGISINKGLNFTAYYQNKMGFTARIGITYMDVYFVENEQKSTPLLTEKVNGTFMIGYRFPRIRTTIDYSGNVVSPMLLPTLGELDPRSKTSPWWSVQHVTVVHTYNKKVSFYFGIKNLWNWTPNKGNPFIIARANDPFDKQVKFIDGVPQITPDNPSALTFDPTYVYAPNQSRRFLIGLRCSI